MVRGQLLLYIMLLIVLYTRISCIGAAVNFSGYVLLDVLLNKRCLCGFNRRLNPLGREYRMPVKRWQLKASL